MHPVPNLELGGDWTGRLRKAIALYMGPGLHLRIGVECSRPGGKREDSPGKVREQLEIKGV